MNSTTTTTGRLPADICFGLTWVIVVTIGFVLGLLGGLPISWALGEPLVRSLGETAAGALSMIAFSAIFGLGIGAAQAIVLRRRLSNPLGWLLASVVGSVLPVLIVTALLRNDPLPDATEVMGLVAGSLIGLSMGTGQWLAERNLAPRMAWWPVFSTAGLLAGWVTVFSLANEDLAAPAVILGGVLAAVITGLGMIWLLKE